MKRIIVSLLLLVAMLAGMMSVHAAEAEITVQVCASKTEVQVGDTVEYTVLATGSGVVAMQFEVRLPDGLRYVSNSGATPENLAKKLGVPAADWTEISRMFTFYNDVGITFEKGTEILRFSCVAEKEGELAPELFELLPFDGDFQEFAPKLQIQKVRVTTGTVQTQPSNIEEPQFPDFDEPAVTLPEETSAPADAQDVLEATDPAVNDDSEEMDVLEELLPEVIAPDELPDDDLDIEKEPNQEDKQPSKEKTVEISRVIILPLAGLAAIAAGVVVYILIKKRKAP